MRRLSASRLVALLPALGAGPYNASSAQPATKPTMTSGRMILVLAVTALLFGLAPNLSLSPRVDRRIVPRLRPLVDGPAGQPKIGATAWWARFLPRWRFLFFRAQKRRHVCDRHARFTKAKDDRESP